MLTWKQELVPLRGLMCLAMYWRLLLWFICIMSSRFVFHKIIFLQDSMGCKLFCAYQRRGREFHHFDDDPENVDVFFKFAENKITIPHLIHYAGQ